MSFFLNETPTTEIDRLDRHVAVPILDGITARKMRFDLMEILMRAKTTILFVTHDLGEAVFLSDQIYMMSTKPARIFKQVAVDIPRPRKPEDQIGRAHV